MVMRYDPFSQIDRLTQQLAGRLQETRATMPMDAYRRGDQLVVHFDLPGVATDSIEVTAEQGTLTVHAERGWDPQPDDQLIANERQQGSFTRELLLGEHLDVERMQADYEDGVLTLTIPVAPAAQPRRIQVRGRSHSEALDVDASGSNGEETASPE